MSVSNSFRLGSPDLFPPAERHVYLDAASVGLSHKGSAAAISRWQNALAEQGTIAFDEQAEVECLDNLNAAAAGLFNATPDDIAIASSETDVSPALQKLNPGILGWRSHKDMWDFQADRLDLPDSAKRYEFGTMAYGTAYGATESVRHILATGVHRIAAHNRKISDHLIDGLNALGAEVLGPKDSADRSAIVAARFPGRNSREFAQTLKQANVIASLRRDFIRFSPHYYNNIDDIDQGLAAIKAAL